VLVVTVDGNDVGVLPTIEMAKGKDRQAKVSYDNRQATIDHRH
jgi:hypothetical protein